MALTPNILMAGDGLIADTALARVPLNTAAINTYLAQAIVAKYQTTVDAFVVAEAATDIIQDRVTDLVQALDPTAPYISNSGSSYTDGNGDYVTGNATTILNQHVANLFQSNQQFVLYALIGMGEVDKANKYINAAVNSAALTAQTYTTQDALITGNLAAVSSDANAWGHELIASGTLFDFKKLDHLGTPQAIIEALIRGNMLGMISDELTTQGLDVVTLKKAIKDNPDLMLTPLVQKRCYYVLQRVDGDKLIDILEMLAFQTPGINLLADLMDLTKVFPTTYTTLTAPKDGTLRPIFTNAGNITDHFSDVVAPLSAVIPDDIAIGNNVFTCSLSQVTGIRNSSPDGIGSAACDIEDNEGLGILSVLPEAVPPEIAQSIIDDFAGGSGPNGSWYLTDLLGAVTAEPHNTIYPLLNTNFDSVELTNGFDDIDLVLDEMLAVLAGNRDYIDPGGGTPFDYIQLTEPWKVLRPFSVLTITPGTDYYIQFPGTTDFTLLGAADNNVGTFFTANATAPTGTGMVTEDGYYLSHNEDQPLIDLLDGLQYHAEQYIVAYPTEHAAMLPAFNLSNSSILASLDIFWDANVRWYRTYIDGRETIGTTAPTDGLPANKGSTFAFAENLPNYGKKTDKGNIAEILEPMATDTLGGNAIIAAMREGRNAAKISGAGIKTDTDISDKPTTVEPGIIS